MTIKYLSTVEIQGNDLGFAGGHFTIFSATKREALHGHNYTVSAALTTYVTDTGIMFDYRHYKQKIREICSRINLTFLLPLHSPFLKIIQQDEFIFAQFDQEKIPFLKKDVSLLPITNVTVEELSRWFLQELLTDNTALATHAIQHILVKVHSGPGQSGSATWECPKEKN